MRRLPEVRPGDAAAVRVAGVADDGRAAPVWARKTVALETCPKSYITAESEALVEEFLVRRGSAE